MDEARELPEDEAGINTSVIVSGADDVDEAAERADCGVPEPVAFRVISKAAAEERSKAKTNILTTCLKRKPATKRNSKL